MKEIYQPNNPITGDYDVNCAAVCKNGAFVGIVNEGVTAFRGIPFAEPPVGPLRWKEPMPASAREGVFEALHNGPTAIQTELDSERASFYHQSEDCLYLNVWTAKDFVGAKRPVMVFIHGGNYGWGGTADPLYDGHNFVASHPEIVLVTIAYRVGIFGFMDFSSVPGGEAFPKSGNLGLLDQICALRYIRENIESFGGDPDNVTIFGESAGAGSVSLLPLIPAAKGLFSRVIAESGSIALTYSREEMQPLTRQLLKHSGAKTMADLCALSEAELKKINEKVGQTNNFPERDGIVLPMDLYAAYKNGEAYPVDMLIGTNADELRYWILDLGGLAPFRQTGYLMYEGVMKQFDKQDRRRVNEFLRLQAKKGITSKPYQVTELFNELLFRLPAVSQGEMHAANGNRVYQYYWTYPSSIPHLKACHAVELAYVFGNLRETIYTGENPREELSETVRQMWTNFARTGDPSIEGTVWTPYTARDRGTMLLGEKIGLEKDWRETERKYLLPLLRYRINGNSLNLTAGLNKFLITAAIVAGVSAAALLLRFLFNRDSSDE
ncbi:MAG: carboxylesterase family protein [Clostridia bacterium]|nr:carboxylesterase family protein [Clostridia bacterium]